MESRPVESRPVESRPVESRPGFGNIYVAALKGQGNMAIITINDFSGRTDFVAEKT